MAGSVRVRERQRQPTRRRPMRRAAGAGAGGRIASTCSSAWTTRRSCSCTRTASRSCRSKEKTLIWHLYQAALAGRDIYYDQRYAHNLEMRDVLEEILTHPAGDRSGDARGDPALHEAVLDQHRPVQQPDRAQVRPEDARRRRSPRRRRRRRRTARSFRLQTGESLDAMLTRLQPMFFDATVDPIVTNKTPGAGQGHPRVEREQPVRRRDDEGPRGLRREVSASTRGW